MQGLSSSVAVNYGGVDVANESDDSSAVDTNTFAYRIYTRNLIVSLFGTLLFTLDSKILSGIVTGILVTCCSIEGICAKDNRWRLAGAATSYGLTALASDAIPNLLLQALGMSALGTGERNLRLLVSLVISTAVLTLIYYFRNTIASCVSTAQQSVSALCSRNSVVNAGRHSVSGVEVFVPEPHQPLIVSSAVQPRVS